ncbi:hypothetical protein [Streptomyces sp. KL118A]|uniref:hypothetical protein n=1 Tax=Streptomyces sp. KL118A TaxID=3045153 RepID=UPI00278BFD81|nr:hypothetical protein [Streptomyces sp. KL118A]
MTAPTLRTPLHGGLSATLGALLAGVPERVRAAFLTRTLGLLPDDTDASRRTLLHPLETYLAPRGSWAPTASRTGRDLSRLDHKLDLYAAPRCR